jgi:serine/threonine-protein kinase
LRAHEAGVVHRDIKPANIFLSRREGQVMVKLLDFGIARVKEQLADSENPALTTTGLMLGTPLYMSPEQAVGPKNIDARTDLFSLGVVLYEMLTGRTPHDVETVGALILAICTKPAPDVRASAPHVSERTAAIVAKLLSIDRAARYDGAAALLTDLSTAQGSSDVTIDEAVLDALPVVAPPSLDVAPTVLAR